MFMYSLTLNPSWNETLVFNVTSFDSPLTFFVYDYDIKDDDLLGTASISLRDNMYILDGQPHELPPISLDKQGTITVQLTCYFDGSKYFNSVASYDLKEEMKEEEKKKAEKKEGEEEKCAQKLSCVDCYRLLYSTFNEDTNLTYERPLILKEFSTRFCVSNAYCSYL